MRFDEHTAHFMRTVKYRGSAVFHGSGKRQVLEFRCRTGLERSASYKQHDAEHRISRKPVPKRKLSNWSNCKYVEAHPDVYLKEIAEQFGCHSFSVLNRLRKLCIT